MFNSLSLRLCNMPSQSILIVFYERLLEGRLDYELGRLYQATYSLIKHTFTVPQRTQTY